MKREETVASVVLQPKIGHLTLRMGHPCESRSESFSIEPFSGQGTELLPNAFTRSNAL